MIFELNPSLTEQSTRRGLELAELTGQIREKVSRINFDKIPWQERQTALNQTALIRTPNFPENANLQKSFLYALSNAYSLHRKVSFGPHDLWYVMLTEIARLVNGNPEQFRHLFTKQAEGKIEISVPTGDPTHLPIELVMRDLHDLVPVDTDLFIPQFSTMTPEAEVACMAAFADTVKCFYNYSCFCCGLPALEVLGTVDDWNMFAASAGSIRNMLDTPATDSWLTGIVSRVLDIRDSLEGGDSSFYQNIFTQKNIGSGGELQVNGWFTTEFYLERCDFPKIQNFPMSWSTVPFKNVESQREFTDVYGAFHSIVTPDGFYQPQYSRFTFEHLK